MDNASNRPVRILIIERTEPVMLDLREIVRDVAADTVVVSYPSFDAARARAAKDDLFDLALVGLGRYDLKDFRDDHEFRGRIARIVLTDEGGPCDDLTPTNWHYLPRPFSSKEILGHVMAAVAGGVQTHPSTHPGTLSPDRPNRRCGVSPSR